MIEWILDRSTVEVLLFLIWLCLVRIAGHLIGLKANLVWVKAALEADIQEVARIAHAIMTATEEISTTTRESMDLVEEIRKVHAPRSYEIDRDSY